MIAFDPTTDPFTQTAIQRKASELIASAGFSGDDREDLEQELLTYVMLSLEHFNADVGHLHPFVITVINRKGRNLSRRQLANKRSSLAPVQSLSVTIKADDDASCELSQLVCAEDADRRLARQRRPSDEELASLRQDMAAVIAKMPEPWQQLLEHSKTLSLHEIVKVMRVPRSTLTEWLKIIRERFVEAGLENYFQK